MSERTNFSSMSERTKRDALLSPQSVAKQIGVTDRTVLRYIETGALPAVRLPGGRLWRIRQEDVDALLTTEASA